MSGWTSLIEPLASALGHAVVQSLWQCALIGAVAAALLLGVGRASVRYWVWCAAMLASAGWFVWTFVSGIELPVTVSAGAGRGMIMRPAATMAPSGRGVGVFEIVALLWGIGFLLVSIRYLRQWGAAQRLRRREVVEASGEWAAVFEEMRAALGVSRRVRMLVSGIARCPVVVGVVSPVVIVPSSVLLMMSPEQVRMVLAHELAHIRRHDHLVNMLQVLVETVMFYHPVVWWMSRCARLEREHCCDDAAVRECGDARGFARALTELEEIRQSSRALLAINDGGTLMNRVKRIIDGTPNRRGMISMRVLGVLLASMVIGVAACANSALREEARDEVSFDTIRAALESGEISAEQARLVYERDLVPGSWIQQRIDEERAYWAKELTTYGLSDERLRKTLAAMERDFDQRMEQEFRIRVLGLPSREVVLALYRDELDWSKREEGLSDEAADRLYAKRVEEMSKPPVVINVPDGAVPQTNRDEEPVHHMLFTPKGSSIDGAPVRLVEGNTTAGTFEVEENVGLESSYKPGQRVKFTPGMSMGMVRAMTGKTEEELLNERNGIAPARDSGVDTLRFPGLGPDAPEIHREHEIGTFAYLERTLQPTIIEQVKEDVNAGRITEREGSQRIERERRRLRFEARWMNVTDLYQTEVVEGRMTVDEANSYLEQIMEERDYFQSEFAKEGDLQLMKVVDPDRLLTIEVSQDGQPVGSSEQPAPLEIKAVPEKQGRKLTPMDEEFWHFQGIRSLSEYEEENPDDC